MAFDEPEVRLLFPVPLLTVRLHEDGLNARLIEEIMARRAIEAGIDRSNRHGWHSANDLFDRTEPAHRALAGELKAIATAANAKMIPDLPRDLAASQEGWVNINPPGAMNAPHDHPRRFLVQSLLRAGATTHRRRRPDVRRDRVRRSARIDRHQCTRRISDHENPLHVPTGGRHVPVMARLSQALGLPQPVRG